MRGERGASSVELVIVTPVLIMLILLVVGLGRMTLARQDVDSAAYEAARAASLQRAAGAAARDGHAAARRAIDQTGLSCHHLQVDVDTSDYQPGGHIQASVTCVADLSDVTLSGLPGTKTYTSDASVPIEQWRGPNE